MLTAKLILERFDKDHRLLERREQPSRSFVLGFLKLLYVAHAQIQAAAPYSMADIDGIARNIDGQASAGANMRNSKANLMIGSTPGSSGVLCDPGDFYSAGADPVILACTIPGEKIGIVVGTGVGVVAPTDIALGTRILHGRAVTQLEYGGCELINLVFAGANGEFTIRRYFTNSSGVLITLQEAGIYSVGTLFTATAAKNAWPFCIARDLTGAVPVNIAELLRVTYVVQITV